MLLRAGLIYCLAVFSLLLGAMVLWSKAELGAAHENALALTERVEVLQKNLHSEHLRAEAAERRALVAEDSLQRTGAQQADADNAAHETRLRLAEQLTAALRERDQARVAAERLAKELELAQASLNEAQAAAVIAKAEAERAMRAHAEAGPVTAPQSAVPAKVADHPAKSASEHKDGAAQPAQSSKTSKEPQASATGRALETSSITAPVAVPQAPPVVPDKPKAAAPAKAAEKKSAPAKAEVKKSAPRKSAERPHREPRAARKQAQDYGITPF